MGKHSAFTQTSPAKELNLICFVFFLLPCMHPIHIYATRPVELQPCFSILGGLDFFSTPTLLFLQMNAITGDLKVPQNNQPASNQAGLSTAALCSCPTSFFVLSECGSKKKKRKLFISFSF